MKKKDVFLTLTIIFLVIFAGMFIAAITEFLSLNVLYSVVPLVFFAVCLFLYSKENAQAKTEQDFITAEKSRKTEKPKFARDFEIVRDCCDNIVSVLKNETNIIAIGVSNNTYEYDGYYELKVDSFEFLDCLYFSTYEMIEEVPADFLAVLEEAFLTRKFTHIDATYAGDSVFFFKRDDEMFSETFYVYSEAPDAFADSDMDVVKLGGYWYFVQSTKSITELLNI